MFFCFWLCMVQSYKNSCQFCIIYLPDLAGMWCTYWANKYLSHVKRLWHDRVGAREIPDGHSFALNSYLCKKWLSSTEYVEKPTYPSYIHILRGSLLSRNNILVMEWHRVVLETPFGEVFVSDIYILNMGL